MADPQSKRGKTVGEYLFGSKEGNAIASAEYKRGMGIDPKAKRLSNAEASRSSRSMSNPTSAPNSPSSKATQAPKTRSTGAGPMTGSRPYKPTSPKGYSAMDKFSGSGDYSSLRKPKAASPAYPSPVAPIKQTGPKAAAPKAAAPKASTSKAPTPKAKPMTTAKAPTPKAKPAAPRGGSGVVTGKVTGSSASRAGTGGMSKMTPYQRMMRNARDK
jgi:hypothetical protein